MRQLLSGILCLAALASAAHAQTIVYDNTATPTAFVFKNLGATSTITNLVADKITFAPGSAGQIITSLKYSVGNFNAVSTSARPLIRFYATDGAGGAPGTFITGYSFSATTFVSGFSPLFSASVNIPIPASGDMWAGITFDNVGSTTAAGATELNNLGQIIYGPPTVGSSADSHWVSTAPGSFSGVNSPAGTETASPFGGAPVANYGWQFTAIPEPGSVGLLALGLLSGGGLLARRRRSA